MSRRCVCACVRACVCVSHESYLKRKPLYIHGTHEFPEQIEFILVAFSALNTVYESLETD